MLSTGKLNKNRDRRIYISRIIESKDDGGRLQEMQASFYVRKCRTLMTLSKKEISKRVSFFVPAMVNYRQCVLSFI